MDNKPNHMQYNTEVKELNSKTIDSSITTENEFDNNSSNPIKEESFATFTNTDEKVDNGDYTYDDEKRILKSDFYQFNSEEFFGEIIEINKEKKTFTVKIAEGKGNLNREAVFNYNDIDAQETEKIQLGAKVIFIYGKQSIDGTIYNFSKIYFRKQMNWTKNQIDRTLREAADLYNLLQKNENESNN